MQALWWLVRGIDWINQAIGRVVSWLVVGIVLLVFVLVVLRYLFNFTLVWLDESYLWAHGVVIMVGAAYTLLHDGHVRIDLFYREAGRRYKALVNLLGSVFLGLPVIWLIFDRGYDFVLRSWMRLETSSQSGGLPGLFLIKSMILVFAVLMGLQLLSLSARSLLELAGRKPPPLPQERPPAQASAVRDKAAGPEEPGTASAAGGEESR